MLVDDEEAVLRALVKVLGRHYDVTTVSSAERALQLIAGSSWHAILTDVMMPGLTGIELARRALQLCPPLAGRVVLMSGGVPPDVHSKLLSIGLPVLSKPFSLEQARAVLDQLVLVDK